MLVPVSVQYEHCVLCKPFFIGLTVGQCEHTIKVAYPFSQLPGLKSSRNSLRLINRRYE